VTGSELDAVLKAAVVACFNILSRIVSGGTQVKLKNFKAFGVAAEVTNLLSADSSK
jgi:hypothetical protein